MTESAAVDKPSIGEQVAAIDAISVATRVLATGPRGAMQASTVEIIAMAKRVLTLTNLADLTHDMLATSDRAAATPKAERAPLLRELDRKVDLVGVSLEALGYGTQPQPLTSEEEKNDGGS